MREEFGKDDIQPEETESQGVEPRDEPFALLVPERRSDQYIARHLRKQRRQARKERRALLVQPPGVLSLTVRALLVTLSLVVIISAGLPYLSLQYQKSALALAKTDGVRAVDRAGTAHWLQPADPGPNLTQAGIYLRAASVAAASGAPDRAGAVLDNLALSIDRFETAISLEPADWSLRYRAGVATLNLLLATEYAGGKNPEVDYATLIPLVPDLEDWSALLGSGATPFEPGLAAGSLAAPGAPEEIAARYRNLSGEALSKLALDLLSAAKERNPFESGVAKAIGVVELVAGP